MSQPADQNPSNNLTLTQFADRFRSQLVPLKGTSFSYFCAASLPFTEEDARDYLEEPIAALPPSIVELLPRISILIVPYLTVEKSDRAAVSMVAPPEEKLSWTAQLRNEKETVLAFTYNGHDVSEYHYRFYQHISNLVWDRLGKDSEIRSRFASLLVEETNANVHGEVDEDSWRAKQLIERRGVKAKGTSKVFQEYVKASFVDTLTLYLHGICCDIDVDTGPRQLPSRYLRKRLVALKESYPPPADYYVLPEDMKHAPRNKKS